MQYMRVQVRVGVAVLDRTVKKQQRLDLQGLHAAVLATAAVAASTAGSASISAA
jgi:hypothetical protein